MGLGELGYTPGMIPVGSHPGWHPVFEALAYAAGYAVFRRARAKQRYVVSEPQRWTELAAAAEGQSEHKPATGGVVDDETAEGDEADLASVADWAVGSVLGAGAGGPGVGVGAVAAACCSGLGGGCVILNTAANCGS